MHLDSGVCDDSYASNMSVKYSSLRGAAETNKTTIPGNVFISLLCAT